MGDHWVGDTELEHRHRRAQTNIGVSDNIDDVICSDILRRISHLLVVRRDIRDRSTSQLSAWDVQRGYSLDLNVL